MEKYDDVKDHCGGYKIIFMCRHQQYMVENEIY